MLILMLTYELKIENLVFLMGITETYKSIYLKKIILPCTLFPICFIENV